MARRSLASLVAALCPAGGIVVVHGPEGTKPASPPACGARRLLVDLEDAPLYDDGSNLWSCDPFQPHRTPMGSIVFALVDEDGTELSVATVYASLGLPSDALEEAHAELLPSPCSWELFDISTAAAHRRQGHATVLIDAIIRWLNQHYGDTVPALYARDASSIGTLYPHWGFTAADAECAPTSSSQM